MRETGRYGGRLLFGFTEKNRKLFNSRHRDITAVVSGKKRLNTEHNILVLEDKAFI